MRKHYLLLESEYERVRREYASWFYERSPKRDEGPHLVLQDALEISALAVGMRDIHRYLQERVSIPFIRVTVDVSYRGVWQAVCDPEYGFMYLDICLQCGWKAQVQQAFHWCPYRNEPVG